MSKLLLICDVYPPSFAPRMGYLVKYMKEWGWTADIVTRGLDGDYSFQSLLGEESVLRVNDLKIPLQSVKDKIFKLIRLKRIHQINANRITDRITDELQSEKYSLILCSTAHRTFLLDVAWQVSNEWKLPWIADLRDLDEQRPIVKNKPTNLLSWVVNRFQSNYHKYAIKQRNKRLSRASALISVSPWHVNQVEKYNANSYLIYNGFDPEAYFPKVVKKLNAFNITYTGTVHYGRHDPELLFQATKKLKEKKIINKTDFRIQFYVPTNWRKNIIISPTYTAVQDFVHFYDYIDTAEVPDLLNESAILLLLANLQKLDGPKGLISTTKYFEYLAVETPILCVRSDEDLLEDSIKKANAGVAARTVEETYDFLLKKWNEWKETGTTTVHTNREYTKQFSRKLQAKQFVDIFNKIVRN